MVFPTLQSPRRARRSTFQSPHAATGPDTQPVANYPNDHRFRSTAYKTGTGHESRLLMSICIPAWNADYPRRRIRRWRSLWWISSAEVVRNISSFRALWSCRGAGADPECKRLAARGVRLRALIGSGRGHRGSRAPSSSVCIRTERQAAVLNERGRNHFDQIPEPPQPPVEFFGVRNTSFNEHAAVR